jgi:glycerol-3-phosphate acyltransferase PlsX
VRRPAIAVPIPARKGPSVLIDAGANADCRAEHLLQFATMGAVFAEEILDIARPSVRLLSIGEEPEKGNQLSARGARAAQRIRPRLPRQRRGPRTFLEGAADVLVTDGFTGNVALKAVEGRSAPCSTRCGRRSPRARRNRSAGCSFVRPRGGCASASIPTPTAARTSSACAGSS